MPKKIARHQPVPRKVARATQKPGLIVKAVNAMQSAMATPALDNRSHRTDSVKLRRIGTISRWGHERSECLSAYHSSGDSFNAC